MTARIIDGKTISADLRGKVTDTVHRLRRDRGVVPGLAVVLVGENPASEVYVRNKSKAVAESGMQAFDRRLPATASEAELIDLIGKLNNDGQVNGILVPLPLPKQIDTQKVIAAIDPAKDVDGFHPLNVGRLASGLPALVPCTPLGCVRLANAVATRATRAWRPPTRAAHPDSTSSGVTTRVSPRSQAITLARSALADAASSLSRVLAIPSGHPSAL